MIAYIVVWMLGDSKVHCHSLQMIECEMDENCHITHSHNSKVRADSRFMPSQWETALLCNEVSNWLGASLEFALKVAAPGASVTNID